MDPDKISILAVDDEANIRELLKRGLARAGYRCVAASSAGQAAELLERDQFALVLLDIAMPEKSGMELLPEITAHYPETGVMMITGFGDTATAVKAMREGAFDYITKPFALDELVTRIENALTRRALVLENREYQQNLEQLVSERTEQLQQRVQELTALNRLFQEHLAQRFQVVGAYRDVRERLKKLAKEADALVQHAEGQPLPDLEEVPGPGPEDGIPSPHTGRLAN